MECFTNNAYAMVFELVTPAFDRAAEKPAAWWAGVAGRGLAAAWAAVWLVFIVLMLVMGDDPITRGEGMRMAAWSAFAAAVGIVPWVNRRAAVILLAAAGAAAPAVTPALICGWGNWPWAAVAWAVAVFTFPFWLAAALLIWSGRGRGGDTPNV